MMYKPTKYDIGKAPASAFKNSILSENGERLKSRMSAILILPTKRKFDISNSCLAIKDGLKLEKMVHKPYKCYKESYDSCIFILFV